MKISSSDLQPSLEDSPVRHHIASASEAVFHDEELTIADSGVINVNRQGGTPSGHGECIWVRP
jgi:hypothetical protein